MVEIGVEEEGGATAEVAAGKAPLEGGSQHAGVSWICLFAVVLQVPAALIDPEHHNERTPFINDLVNNMLNGMVWLWSL